MSKIISAIMALVMSLTAGLYTPVTKLPEIEKSDDAISAKLVLMNYNVYVAGIGDLSPNNRTDEVAATIRNVMPDSFGVEEADEGWVARLSVALPEYAHVGLGRNNDYSGEASPVFYLKNKYRLVSDETIWLSPTPEKPSRGWDSSIQRVATIAVLENKVTGFRYAHINAHFDHIGIISRNEAAAVISKKASTLNMPVVFSGDLNAKEGTLMYQRILDAGFRDTKYIAKYSDSGATFHGYSNFDKLNDKPIDYIFVNSACSSCRRYSIIRDKINGIYPSDHYAVAVQAEFFYNP